MDSSQTIIGKDILLLGIGTVGSRAAYYIYQCGSLPGLRIIAMDSDANDLQKYTGLNTIVLPEPEELPNAAEIENMEYMPACLKNAFDAHLPTIAMVLVVAGLGGKTGGRYALQAVSYARQQHLPCAAVVLLPHEFEGEERRTEAENNLMILNSMIPTVTVLPCSEFMQLFPDQSKSELYPQAVRWMAESSLGFLRTFARLPQKKRSSAVPSAEEDNQLLFLFPDEPRGIFTGGVPSNYYGQNYDIPTFKRLNIELDLPRELEEE